jgi:three-Cys-motif partner protein
MLLKDNSEEKWEMTDHCKVKHILFEKYLHAWIPILGRYEAKIAYIDGFAGRGKYNDGSYGSPILAIKAFQDVANYSSVKGIIFICYFIEQNKDNHDNLLKVLEEDIGEDVNDNIKCCVINGTFDTIINQILDEADDKIIPTFFFIDPFGFTGVPFTTIKRILSIPKTEIFFNFMVRDVNRFLSIPNQESNMNSLFGCDDWKKYINLTGQKRQNALRDLYIRQLIDNKLAKYVWPFKICEDTRCATLYYLLHATNSFKGLDVMKTIMFNQSEYFAYLGPDEFSYQDSRYNQLRIFDFNIDTLKEFLLKFFEKNKKYTYEEIKEKSYLLTPSVDKHYRKAIKELEKEYRVIINRISSKKSGIKGNDEITFL